MVSQLLGWSVKIKVFNPLNIVKNHIKVAFKKSWRHTNIIFGEKNISPYQNKDFFSVIYLYTYTNKNFIFNNICVLIRSPTTNYTTIHVMLGLLVRINTISLTEMFSTKIVSISPKFFIETHVQSICVPSGDLHLPLIRLIS